MILLINEFIKEIDKNYTYCIIKADPCLPAYKSGSDIDIFCYDIDGVINAIIKKGNNLVGEQLEVEVTRLENQAYVDFVHKNTNVIEFRFDLYSSLPLYNKLNIRSSFFENILENRVCVEVDSGFRMFVPNRIDEFVLRYIEYHEWYSERPDKLKHLEYILTNAEDGERTRLFEKLHYYTALPLVVNTYPLIRNSNRKFKCQSLVEKSKALIIKIYVNWKFICQSILKKGKALIKKILRR